MILRLLTAAALATACAAAAQPPEEEGLPEETEEGEEMEEGEEGGLVKPPAALPPARPVLLRVGGALAWDSNFFRSPSAREELVASAYAGVSIDKAYAQQRFRADVTETAYRYDNFPHLDFNALNYLGAWDWRLGPRIAGTLEAARAQGLVDYSDFRNPGQRNVRTTENFALGADAWLFGGWHLTGALRQERNRYSVPFPQEGSYRADGGEAGVRWVAPSANWLAFKLRSLDGRYLDRPLDPLARIDDGFRRRETEAAASWRFTAKSTLEARAAWVDYDSAHFSERNFSGLGARLRYLWEATAKLSAALQFARELSPWTDISASHRVEERLTFGPVWQVAARTTLRVDASHGESEFRDPLPGFAGTPRRDVEKSLHFQAEWRALRNLSLRAGAQRYRQSSTDPAGNFRGIQVSAGLSLLF